ncbi:MAG: ankyrin repeat domain-containing protein [Verrucomicrobiia bacterium]
MKARSRLIAASTLICLIGIPGVCQAAPIHDAAANGDLAEVAEFLKANTSVVNARDAAERTPLHYAALKGHKEVADLLLANGADANARSSDGSTLLHLAAGNGNKEVVEVLLSKGADAHAEDESGKTPAVRAEQGGHGDLAGLLLDCFTLKELPSERKEEIDRELRKYVGVDKGESQIVDATNLVYSVFGYSEQGDEVDTKTYRSTGKKGQVFYGYYVSIEKIRPGESMGIVDDKGVFHPAMKVVKHKAVVREDSVLFLKDSERYVYHNGQWYVCARKEREKSSAAALDSATLRDSHPTGNAAAKPIEKQTVTLIEVPTGMNVTEAIGSGAGKREVGQAQSTPSQGRTLGESYLLKGTPVQLGNRVWFNWVRIRKQTSDQGERAYRFSVPEGQLAYKYLQEHDGQIQIAEVYPGGRNVFEMPEIVIRAKQVSINMETTGLKQQMGQDLMRILSEQGLVKNNDLLDDVIFVAARFAKVETDFDVTHWIPKVSLSFESAKPTSGLWPRDQGPAVQTAFEAWQMRYFGCANCPQAAPDADPDRDGISNRNEFLAGTDPGNEASSLRILSAVRNGDDVVITWRTVGGRTNVLQATAGDTNAFMDISKAIIIAGTGDIVTNYIDRGGIGLHKYYRIRIEP